MRFAQMLMTFYCTLMFGAGMPLLYGFAAIYCFVTYWADKWVLLKGSMRPPQYDCSLPYQAAQLLLFVIPIHLVVAIGMYSQQCTFPSNPLGGALGGLKDQGLAAGTAHVDLSQATSSKDGNQSMTDRVFLESTWHLFLLLIVCIAFAVIWTVLSVVGGTFGGMLTFVTTLCCSPTIPIDAVAEPKANEVDEDAKDKSVLMDPMIQFQGPIEEHLRLTCPPTSYRIEENPEWKMLAAFVNLEDPIGDDEAPAVQEMDRCSSPVLGIRPEECKDELKDKAWEEPKEPQIVAESSADLEAKLE